MDGTNGDGPAHPCIWNGVECLLVSDEYRVRRISLSTSNMIGPVPTEIGELGMLEWLSLYDNSITELPTELGRCLSLVGLELQLTELGGRTVPTELGNLSEMRVFRLESAQLVGQVPTQVGRLNLDGLLLGDNHFAGRLPTQVGQLSLTTKLTLLDNEITGGIPSQLCRIPRLQHVSLDVNSVRDCTRRSCARICPSITSATAAAAVASTADDGAAAV